LFAVRALELRPVFEGLNVVPVWNVYFYQFYFEIAKKIEYLGACMYKILYM